MALPIALVIVVVAAARRRTAARQQSMAGYAAHREWEYRPADPALVGRFAQAPFGRGSGRTASNVILGTHDGRPFTAFDYRYTTSNGDSNTTHTYSVLALHLGLHAPAVAVGPANAMSRLWDKLAKSDVSVGDPAFDHAFVVKSPLPEFARDVLHPGIIEVLWHHPTLTWRFEADSMIVFRSGEHSPPEIEATLHFMDAVLDRIPEHVWGRLRGETPR